MEITTEQIRAANDFLRQHLCGIEYCSNGIVIQGKLLLTSTVAAEPEETVAKILSAVRSFSDFTENNDPHGEHDFGKVIINGEKYFWKIDCYDSNMEFYGHTVHALLIMRADEY